jgi:membrane dipeptidase
MLARCAKFRGDSTVPTRSTRKDKTLQHATALLDSVGLLDGHNDLPWVIRLDEQAHGDVAAYDLTRVHPESDTDIPRLREGRVSAQVWAAYVPSAMPHPGRTTLEQIDLIHRMHALHPDTFLPATRPSDIARAKRAGKIASIIAVEGGVGLENSLAPLRIWHAAGARLLTLCHFGTLDWCDSATDTPRHGGLTAFGRQVVRELNRLGMMVDCSHVSAEVMHHALDVSTAPIVFSHSNARALCSHPRNVPDDVLERLRAAKDGIVMATFVPDFISDEVNAWMHPLREAFKRNTGGGWLAAIEVWEQTHGPRPQATLEQVADHIQYLAQKIGPARLGIGSDYFGVPTKPAGLMDVSRFPYLIAELIKRGWSDDAITGIAGRNFVRVWREVDREGQRLRRSVPPAIGPGEELDAGG